jgi:hypothetical protein
MPPRLSKNLLRVAMPVSCCPLPSGGFAAQATEPAEARHSAVFLPLDAILVPIVNLTD